jgi:hypothetical protein
MSKISQERADEILDQLDELSAELFAAGFNSLGNDLLGVTEQLVHQLEEAANNTNPFLEIK